MTLTNGPEDNRPQPKSKRFNDDTWAARLAPLILVILVLGLLITVAIVALSVLGITPGA